MRALVRDEVSERERPGSPKEQPVHPLRRVHLLERPVLATDGEPSARMTRGWVSLRRSRSPALTAVTA
jgi:hypothetical protein